MPDFVSEREIYMYTFVSHLIVRKKGLVYNFSLSLSLLSLYFSINLLLSIISAVTILDSRALVSLKELTRGVSRSYSSKSCNNSV